ncbi:hypothetical protein jhhlp_004417 [Lomentospora prolificans]|uniref:Uncharacterized protein n=1 Tax=Lomentospora prolificans TaxID=41688 RepID=A0A2N3NBH3_9PEZI|nr:hypothetical protein jhhlp_004417 [Lomentospora prolificans]
MVRNSKICAGATGSNPFDSDRLQYRKIHHLLLVSSGLDMLKVRLGDVYPYVDYFVILETDGTFSDKPKKR